MGRFVLPGLAIMLAGLLGIVATHKLQAAVGDCLGANVEENADCDSQGNCAGATQGTCRAAAWTCAGSACNPSPCQAELPIDVRIRGECANGWSDDGCNDCSNYTCGAWVAYQSIDQYGACQTARCTGTWSCTDCCYPDGQGT